MSQTITRFFCISRKRQREIVHTIVTLYSMHTYLKAPLLSAMHRAASACDKILVC